METYTFLRELADSWVLLAMFLFFVAAGIWAFLPSQNAAREDARMIPLRDDIDAKPAGDKTNGAARVQDKGQAHD